MSGDSSSPKVIPSKLVETLEIEQVLDLISCPFRFWKGSIERQSSVLPPFLFARKVFDLSIRKALEAKQQSRENLLHDDLCQIVTEVCLDLRPDIDPNLLEACQIPILSWWRHVGAKAIPLIVSKSFLIDLGGWRIRGRIPLVFRSPEARFDQIALPSLDLEFDPWTPHRLKNDLRMTLVHLGALQIGLETNSVQVHSVWPGGTLKVFDPVIDQDRITRFLVIVAAVREAIVGHCFRPQSWFPNRFADDCRQTLCRHALSCEKTFGGEVRSD